MFFLFFSILRWDPRNQQRFRVSIYLSVAYAANIGGTATLIGSVPPLVLKGVVEEYVAL